jgi:aryl-alcohol dehydrogenase-like predicted oxidoreductase
MPLVRPNLTTRSDQMTVPTGRLGRSNLEGSALGLGGGAIGGAMAAGDQPLGDAGVDHAEAHRPLRRFHPLRLGGG